MKRTLSVLATTALAAGFLAVAPPASAGTTWDAPQQLSSSALSPNGRVVAHAERDAMTSS
jgi:hypothetical protein